MSDRVLTESSGQSIPFEVSPVSSVGNALERPPIIRSFEAEFCLALAAEPDRLVAVEFGPARHDELEHVSFDRTLRT